MRRYIEEGALPGSFLRAVICNKLVEAFAQADSTNILRLFDYADFLYNEVPSPCWGSEEKMLEWAEKCKAIKVAEAKKVLGEREDID